MVNYFGASAQTRQYIGELFDLNPEDMNSQDWELVCADPGLITSLIFQLKEKSNNPEVKHAVAALLVYSAYFDYRENLGNSRVIEVRKALEPDSKLINAMKGFWKNSANFKSETVLDFTRVLFE